MVSEDYDPQQHNYFSELLKVDAKPGTLTEVTVMHDDWCAFSEGGYCDCNPEIVYGPLEVTP
jgi:hypothetical protein